MRRLLRTLNILFLFLFSFTYANVQAETIEPQINAEGSVLIDASTGEVLFGKNEEKSFEPASTTKVMTAIITLEKCKLDDEVTVQEDFTKIDGTAIGLLKGDVLTVKDLLFGLLLESGNDCANALADHISGSVPEFAKLMNAKAKELGALHTNFKNPSGLPDPEHTTTAHDLALFLREAIKNKDYMSITNTPLYTITLKNNPDKTIVVNNKNYMINKNSKYYYPYAISGKNGYTLKANQTYVAAAQKDGHVLVAAFLNALNKDQNFKDMQTVFNYGFDNYSLVHLYKKGDQISEYKINDNLTIPVISSKDIDYVVPKGQENSVSSEVKIEDKDLSNQSFNKGDNILTGTIYVNNKEYTTVDLEAGVSRFYESPIKTLTQKNNLPIFVSSSIVVLAGAFGIRKFLKSKLKK
ncbi:MULTISPECIES: D-alanyl-D-alanine carboxypeptidase family protein [unclassified Clostridium]|uniref:D-alanyl-D-alanine carboxypeptidase family protein n=1 Tax=unclassified Clostridium TaxID=2614128 RepID=UPI0002976739|nr:MULTISPECIES: D-alanyl-D-alanine carboxypeptidase family protein [unclassified Clostridium]EKQ55128.1 MAG: D-alanyl-D-alanine carboxypeptidase [Clostridium sp. Maddingley MBC34-26]